MLTKEQAEAAADAMLATAQAESAAVHARRTRWFDRRHRLRTTAVLGLIGMIGGAIVATLGALPAHAGAATGFAFGAGLGLVATRLRR